MRARVSDGALPWLAITTGEPAGIGPEVSLVAALQRRQAGTCRPILIGDARMLAARARQSGVAVALVSFEASRAVPPGALEVIDIPCFAPVVAGELSLSNAPAVLAMLDRAIDGAMAGEFDAVVTAPVQKSVLNDAGIAFTGHTEHFAERTHSARVVMMLAGGAMRVALATTHLALRDVADRIHQELIVEVLRIIDHDLRFCFGIAAPRILVAGLNPHAGEGGHLGREELDEIIPAIRRSRAAGVNVDGPFPADTLFQPKYLSACDAVLAMFHDQGLPVLKYASFGHGVNITLGLPIIRTSVDHGTALDIARVSPTTADPGSMLAAIDVAIEMVKARRRLP